MLGIWSCDLMFEAVREKHFRIWAMETIDEGIELLTGKSAGAVNREGTLHYLVDQCLQVLGVLEERATTPSVGSPRVPLAPSIAVMPSLPRLPGENN